MSGDTLLVPGMYANVSLGQAFEDIILVPNTAIYERGQLPVVFVDKDGRAEMRIVKTGRRVGNRLEIVSGLHAGERIVVENGAKLKNGDRLGG